MSEGEGAKSNASQPAKKKLGRKRQARDDIFTYRGQMPLSFRTIAKQPLQDLDSSSSDDNDEAFERVREQTKALDDSETRESGSDEDEIWVNDRSVEEQDTFQNDIEEVSLNRSLSPPPAPAIPRNALNMMVHQRQTHNKRLRELDNVLDSLKKSAEESLSSPLPEPRRLSSIINVDDTDFLPSPSERNVAVKVRTGSGIKRFTMKAAESFGTIISQLANQEGVTEDKIMLSLGHINILGYDTPVSVKLSVADIIECVILNSPAPIAEEEETDYNKIDIKVQGSDSDSKKNFKVFKTEPLEKLMKEYCDYRKLPRSRLKFSFDGEELKGTETAVDLDMEDEDVIDVRVT